MAAEQASLELTLIMGGIGSESNHICPCVCVCVFALVGEISSLCARTDL